MGIRVVGFATVTTMFIVLAISALPSAYSHATISPRISGQGRVEVYQLVLFGERNTPTVGVELVVPVGIEVQSVEPTAGWTYTLLRNASSRVSSILWKGSLGLGGQVELRFAAKNTGQEGRYAFRALQTYADGEVAEWDYPGMEVRLEVRPEPINLPAAAYLVTGIAIATFLGVMLLRRRIHASRGPSHNVPTPNLAALPKKVS